ncbi:MAG TPA: DUF222 domain-containing protein [Jiangellaceae bacterium]
MSAATPVPIPDELESVPPGAVLAELLESLAVEEVSGFDTVRLLEAAYRQLSHVRAVFLSILRETGLRRPGSVATIERTKAPNEFACEEARAALVWSRARATSTYGFATDMFDRLPVLGEAMLAGRLDEPRARAFVEWTQGLTDAQAESVCEQLLPEAAGLMVGELIDRIKRACLAIDPEWAAKKYREAVRTRRVAGSRNPDGTANLGGYQQPIDRIAAASEHIDTLARSCKRAGDRRPIDHIRSDLFLGMVDGTFEALTDAEIVEHVLAHPYIEPSDGSGGDRDRASSDGEDGHGDQGDGGIRPGGGGGATGGEGADPAERGTIGGTADRSESADVAERGNNSRDLPAGGNTTVASRTPVAEPAQPAAASPVSTAWAVPEVRVELATLLGINEHPGEIPPWGPIPAAQARELVAGMGSAEWRFVLCDPTGRATAGGLLRARPTTTSGGSEPVRRDPRRGGVVEVAVRADQLARIAAAQPPDGPWKPVLVELARHAEQRGRDPETDARDTGRRTAAAALRRWIQLRDRRCIHPCCRMPAAKADQDHRIGYAVGGATVGTNLSTPCRHDHRLKDEAGWTIARPESWLTVWTSPLGHRYESRPPPVIADLPEPLPPLDPEQPGPGGRLVWQPRPDPCTCEGHCDCRPPILPPSPRRVPLDQPARHQEPTAIFDPDEAPPF